MTFFDGRRKIASACAEVDLGTRKEIRIAHPDAIRGLFDQYVEIHHHKCGSIVDVAAGWDHCVSCPTNPITGGPQNTVQGNKVCVRRDAGSLRWKMVWKATPLDLCYGAPLRAKDGPCYESPLRDITAATNHRCKSRPLQKIPPARSRR